MKSNSNDLIFLLAGFGLGAVVGAVAGVLLAPAAGEEVRGQLADKAKELTSKTGDWVSETSSNVASKAQKLTKDLI